jgi:hypothetical protein
VGRKGAVEIIIDLEERFVGFAWREVAIKLLLVRGLRCDVDNRVDKPQWPRIGSSKIQYIPPSREQYQDRCYCVEEVAEGAADISGSYRKASYEGVGFRGLRAGSVDYGVRWYINHLQSIHLLVRLTIIVFSCLPPLSASFPGV